MNSTETIEVNTSITLSLNSPRTKSSRPPSDEFFINLKVISKNKIANPIIEIYLLVVKLSEIDSPQKTRHIFTKIPNKYKIF